MARSRSFLKILWDFFFKPSRPAYASERKGAGATKRKSKAKGAAKPIAKAKTKQADPTGAVTPDQPGYWGYVDAKGNVRLNGSKTIIGRSQKSKKAALEEFGARYQQQSERLAAFEVQGKAMTQDQASWADFKSLAEEIKASPGLGDTQALATRTQALSALFEQATQESLQDRKAALEDLALLVKRAPSEDVSGELEQLETQWQGMILTESPEESTLLLKFERNAKSIRQIETSIGSDTDNLADQATKLLADLDARIEASDWAGTAALLDKSIAERAIYVRALGPEIEQDFDLVAKVVETNLNEEREHKLAAQAEADTQRAELLEQLTAISSNPTTGNTSAQLKSIQRQWKSINKSKLLENPAQELEFTEQAAALMDQIRLVKEEAAEERQVSADLRTTLLDELNTIVSSAGKSDVVWREIDQSVQSIKSSWKEAGTPDRDQRGRLSAALDKLNDLRQDYYARQDQGREHALERKRILIADVAKFAPSLSSKQLREHLETHMNAWKQAGSAGREHEEGLWQEYKEQRGIVRHEINRLRAVEAGERAERLSQVFADKKAFQQKLETLLMVDELLLEKNASSSLEKQISRKKKDIRKLQDQIMDIQKTLRQLDKVKQQAPEILREGFDGESEADAVIAEAAEINMDDGEVSQSAASEGTPSDEQLIPVEPTERVSQEQLARAEVSQTLH